jgi:hypothetical protein
MKRSALLVALTALLALAAFVAITRAEPPTGVTPRVLARGTYDGFNVRSDPLGPIDDFRTHSKSPIDIVVRRHDYAPHSTTGWHSHPGPVFITVMQGTLTFMNTTIPPARRTLSRQARDTSTPGAATSAGTRPTSPLRT